MDFVFALCGNTANWLSVVLAFLSPATPAVNLPTFHTAALFDIGLAALGLDSISLFIDLDNISFPFFSLGFESFIAFIIIPFALPQSMV